MMKFSVNQAKSNFFDRAKVLSALDKVALKGLSRFGAFVRRDARRSMRKARQKTYAELTEDELFSIRAREAVAKKKGQPKPKRPLAASKEGEPPRVREGQIKKFLFFSYDPEERSVVIGPTRLNTPTGATETLEKGGFVENKNGRFRIGSRPYMKPAYDKNINQLPAMLVGSN